MDEISIRAKEIAAAEFSDPHQPKHQLGPDYTIPSNEYCTWDPEGAVNLNYVDDGDDDYYKTPESIVSFFRRTVDKFPNNTALSVKRDEVWLSWSYLQYWNEIRTAAKGFIKLGLLPFHGVCVLGFNAPEWIFSFYAAIFAGGFCAGIYTTNSPEACFHVINDSLANIVVVENNAQLQKILQIRDRLPKLKAIIQYIGKPTHPEVLSWKDLIHIGNSVGEDVLERRIKGIAINQCCTISYTSGTTGNPKGVMLSHDNILSMAKLNFKDIWVERDYTERLISYLPLCHLAAVSCDIIVPILAVANVFFAPPDALKGKMVDTLHVVLPTSFVGVPRVFEKIYEKLQEAEAQMYAPKRALVKWAQRQALKHNSKPNNNVEPLLLTVAKMLVLNKVKAAVGLQNSKHLYCGSAPLSVDVQQYFFGLDLPLIEGYGLSESGGIHVKNTPTHYRIGSVGFPDTLKRFEFKLASPDEDGGGEILLRGRNIFMGYMHLQDKTLETIDNERWLHTGDIGKLDSDGFLYITGRIKELIITAGGENIPPVLIEEDVKKLVPAISNCMLIGDKRKYLTLLITFKTELDMDTMQSRDQLTSGAIKWCRALGSNVSSVSEILKSNDGLVMAAIQKAIETYNTKCAVSNAQRIQKWQILAQDFSIPGGELGPTAKLRRPFIEKKYSNIIEQMYGGP